MVQRFRRRVRSCALQDASPEPAERQMLWDFGRGELPLWRKDNVEGGICQVEEHQHVWSAWTTEPRADGAELVYRLMKRCYACGKTHWEDDANGSTRKDE